MALSKLNGNVGNSMDLVLGSDNVALDDKQLSVNNTVLGAFKFGTGAKQANKIHTLQYSIAASATLSLDLDAGTLLDPYGNALTFANIKALRVSHLLTSASSDVKLLGDFLTTVFGASFDMPLPVGASFQYFDNATGLVLVASTGDVIEVTNNDSVNAATVNIDIVGI